MINFSRKPAGNSTEMATFTPMSLWHAAENHRLTENQTHGFRLGLHPSHVAPDRTRRRGAGARGRDDGSRRPRGGRDELTLRRLLLRHLPDVRAVRALLQALGGRAHLLAGDAAEVVRDLLGAGVFGPRAHLDVLDEVRATQESPEA